MIRIMLAALAVIAIGGAIAEFIHHEREIGEQRIIAKDKEIADAKRINNEEVERRAEVLAAKQVGALKAQLAAPPAPDAPSLKCVRSRTDPRSASPVRQDSGPGPAVDGAPQQPAVVSQPSETVDYGPDIDKRFADDDQIIKTLQERIASEVGICR